MSRTTALLGSALFLALAPGTLAGLIPWLIVRWPAPIPYAALAIPGGLILALGLVLLVEATMEVPDPDFMSAGIVAKPLSVVAGTSAT